MRAAGLDMALIVKGGKTSGHGRLVDIERPAQTVQHIGNVRRAIAPAQPQSGQPIGLGKCARGHDIIVLFNEVKPGRIVLRVAIFGISPVQHQYGIPAKTRMQSHNFIALKHCAGRIIGIGEKHHAGGWRHRAQQSVDICRQRAFTHRNRARTRGAAGKLVD